MSSPKWRMFYVVFDLMNERALTYQVAENKTVFDVICSVMKAVLVGHPDAKNFNVKSTVLTQMFKILVNRSLKTLSENKTISFLHVLLQGVKTEWVNIEERTKHLMNILSQINQLIDLNAIILGDQSMEIFEYFLRDAFPVYYKEKKEPTKVEMLKTLRRLVMMYYQ